MLVLQGARRPTARSRSSARSTSIGTFHHGAVYYYLLAPAAFLSGADPVAVTGEIALFGIGAVAAIWWLARLLGGPSPASPRRCSGRVARRHRGVDLHLEPEPDPVRVGARVRGGAARRAQPARALVAAVGASARWSTMQCHVLGVVIVPPLVVAWLVGRVAGGGAGASASDLRSGAGVGGLAIVAAGYLPLLAYELRHDFAETRAILDYLAGGGREAASGALARIVIVGLRSVTWPFAGLLTDRPRARARHGR